MPNKRVRQQVETPGMTPSAMLDLRTASGVRRTASRRAPRSAPTLLKASAPVAAAAPVSEGAQPAVEPQPERYEVPAFLLQNLRNVAEELDGIKGLIESVLGSMSSDILARLVVRPTSAATIPAMLLAQETSLASLREGNSESGGLAPRASPYVEARIREEEEEDDGPRQEPFMLALLADDDSDRENAPRNTPPSAQPTASEARSSHTTVPVQHIPPQTPALSGVGSIFNLKNNMQLVVAFTLILSDIYMDSATPPVGSHEQKLFREVLMARFYPKPLQQSRHPAAEVDYIVNFLAPHFTTYERLPGGCFVMRVVGALLYCFNTYKRHAENADAGRSYVIEWTRDARMINSIIFNAVV